MEIIKLSEIADWKERAVKVLKAGGVVMHATETCYGLAADVFNERALGEVYAIKKMAADKPVSIMVRDLAEAGKYADFSTPGVGRHRGLTALELAKKFWPGPLTLILPWTAVLPGFLNPGCGTVGVRCPDSDVAQALIKAFGGPLTTTSANISGRPEVYKVADYIAQLTAGDPEPDLILDSGELPKNPPSTIVGFEKGELRVIRDGALGK